LKLNFFLFINFPFFCFIGWFVAEPTKEMDTTPSKEVIINFSNIPLLLRFNIHSYL
jgi:hypothetical protein